MNAVPDYTKGDKQMSRNCRPVSLLPICGKIFERLIHDNLFEVFNKNNPMSNESSFKRGDSCVCKRLSITYEIYQSFDNGFEVRGTFLDIFKAFDKV